MSHTFFSIESIVACNLYYKILNLSYFMMKFLEWNFVSEVGWFFVFWRHLISVQGGNDGDGNDDEVGCVCCSLCFSGYSWLSGSSITLAAAVEGLSSDPNPWLQSSTSHSHLLETTPPRTKLLQHCVLSSAGDLNIAAEIFTRIDKRLERHHSGSKLSRAFSACSETIL